MTVTFDLNKDLFRQGIHYRDTHAMQTTGNFISATAEFTACMQHGHYDFKRRLLKLYILTYRYATSIIDNSDRVILMYNHLNPVTITCECLIDTIIDDLPYQVMETFRTSRTNIHARTFPNRFQPFQYLNLALIICRLIH